MFCSRCGQAQPDGTTVCPVCGVEGTGGPVPLSAVRGEGPERLVVDVSAGDEPTAAPTRPEVLPAKAAPSHPVGPLPPAPGYPPAPGAYGAPYPHPGPYGVPPVVYAVTPPDRTNGLAIASLALGFLWLYWLGSVLAVIFGHIALGQIKRSQGMQSGYGLAMAGVILGWIGVGILLLIIVVGASLS